MADRGRRSRERREHLPVDYQRGRGLLVAPIQSIEELVEQPRDLGRTAAAR
jgi:hypothetical protein